MISFIPNRGSITISIFKINNILVVFKNLINFSDNVKADISINH